MEHKKCDFCTDYGAFCFAFPDCKINTSNVRDAILLGSIEEFDSPL